MSLDDGLVSGLPLSRAINPRLRPYEERSFPHKDVAEAEENGWVAQVSRKTVVSMRRDKTHDVLFEDQVWAMLARIGFTRLNSDHKFHLKYGNGPSDTKQVDVFATDGDVALVVECKSSAAERRRTVSLKDEVELLRGYQEGFRAQLAKALPGVKVKFILATNNMQPNSQAQERMDEGSIAYLSEEAVNYYLSLANQIGHAAKYQLLGDLFKGTKIPNLNMTVPAIEGKMGGKKYFSFLIEPDRLLQIAYVLHHRRGEVASYQRIIKKSRLNKVGAFIENGGMFPNSIVINVDPGGRSLKFDRATSTASGGGRLGSLHLPQKYRSAYVIDGQHRLFGYAGTERAASELIPVVAFVDLPAAEQVELFMQINENQQAVPKNLRTALNAELLWKSESLADRANALRSRLAQDLAEDRSSPLFGRIISGEDGSGQRTITLSSITRGINDANFIGRFTASQQKSQGSFFRVGNDQTHPPLRAFLFEVLDRLSDSMPAQWNLGKGGIVFSNPGMVALLTLVGEIVNHERDRGDVDPIHDEPQTVVTRIWPYLEALSDGVNKLSPADFAELKSSYGSTGPQKYLREFQSLVNEQFPLFAPHGFGEWKDRQGQDNKVEAFRLISGLEEFLNVDVKRRLESAYGAEWRSVAVPNELYLSASKLAVERQISEDLAEAPDWWDCLVMSDYDKIVRRKMAIWDAAFGDSYTAPSDRSRRVSSWREKGNWLSRLIEVRNSNSHGRGVTTSDVEFLTELDAWLVTNV